MLLLLDRPRKAKRTPRAGVVHASGQTVSDSDGSFFPLGVTFFWALYGWKFERARGREHLAWIVALGFYYVRILGEVDWQGRSIDPYTTARAGAWPDYDEMVTSFLDEAYDVYGLRVQITLIGGRVADPLRFAQRIRGLIQGREQKVILLEVVNEWERLNKIARDQMLTAGGWLAANTPNLVGLSTPAESDAEHGGQKLTDMIAWTKQVGARLLLIHTRRKEHDRGWAQVRQAYDFNASDLVGNQNEPPGPSSSVGQNTSPLQLALMRALGIVCGAPFYVLHLAAGVAGRVEPRYGRPANLWEVADVDAITNAVAAVESLLPPDVASWKVVNNGRDEHPLPLDGRVGVGFWEGEKAGSVNKNYAAVGPDGQFVVILLGVKAPNPNGPEEQPQVCGVARRRCEVEVFDPVSGALIETAALNAGAALYLPGRVDTMAGYIVRGRYI